MNNTITLDHLTPEEQQAFLKTWKSLPKNSKLSIIHENDDFRYNWAGEKLYPYMFSENEFHELMTCARKGGYEGRKSHSTFAAPPQIDC